MAFRQVRAVGKRPYGRAALSTAAACLKGFYLHQAALGEIYAHVDVHDAVFDAALRTV